MSDSSSAADLIEHVIGYRAWRAARGGQLWSIGVGRKAWERGVNSAACAVGWAHAAPAEACTCGLYALHESPPDAIPEVVVGAVRAHGRLEVHHDGFRAEHAEIVALAYTGKRPGRRARRAARRYGVPLVPLERLEAVAREHGQPIAPALRPRSYPSASGSSRPGGVDALRRAYLRVAVPLRRAPRLRAIALFAAALAPLVTFAAWGYLLSGVERQRVPGVGSLLLGLLPATVGLVAGEARARLGSGWPLPGSGRWSTPALLFLAAPLELASGVGAGGRAVDIASWAIGLLAVGVIGYGLMSMFRPLLMLSSVAMFVAVVLALPVAGGHTLAVLAAAGLVQYAAIDGLPQRLVARAVALVRTPDHAWTAR